MCYARENFHTISRMFRLRSPERLVVRYASLLEDPNYAIQYAEIDGATDVSNMLR